MFSLFKHIDIDCVYQLKTSSIFLPVLHVYRGLRLKSTTKH